MATTNLGRVKPIHRGVYDPDFPYTPLDILRHQGASYFCIKASQGNVPQDGEFFMAIVDGDIRYAQIAGGADANFAVAPQIDGQSLDDRYQQQEAGKGLSTNDYTDNEKSKLEGIEVGATKNATDAQLLNRDNHTGTQPLSTISGAGSAAAASVEDFDAAGSASQALAAAKTYADNGLEGKLDASLYVPAPAVTPFAFAKSDGSRPAWSVAVGNALRTASALTLIVDGALVEISADTVVSLPALSNGTDYTIYAAADGSLQAVDADSAAPADTRAVGGFHASAGGSAIVSSSLWDLNWRPSAPNPRGMVLSLDKRTWADIYLVDVDYALHGYSRNGQRIADGSSLPKIPAEYGGNGSATYDSGSWWTFNDILSAAGKRLPFYQEFTALAYGVVERQAVGTDPVTTQHQAGHRSACGCEQVTGVMYQWGADITGTSATGAVAWQDWADGRGDIYTNSIRAPLFGANWNNGSPSGSRASHWHSQPDNSNSVVGARGVCDHVNLQAER